MTGEKEYRTEYYGVGHGREPVALDVVTTNPTTYSRTRIRRCHHFTVLFALLLFVLYSFVNSNGHTTTQHDTSSPDWFNWTSVKPNKELSWHSCYDGFHCARLEVPLDYSQPTGDTAAVAILRSRSKYARDDERYRGPILFNPGGPGGSGTQFVNIAAALFRKIFGDGYDFVGFDPRGTGFTTPSLSVFPSSVDAGAFFSSVTFDVNSTSESLGDLYARSSLFGKIAGDRARHVAEYVSTPSVARDMMSIVKAHGRDKLLYWGFSYGTVLGATFAAMFPDKIERMIIDGVVDSENYYAGLWSNNLRDTDKVLFELYEACVTAGPTQCPLYEDTPDLIHKRVISILNSLKANPVPYYNPEDNSHSIVDYSNAKYALFSTLYAPYALGAYAMAMMAQLEGGNADLVWMISVRRAAESLVRCDCSLTGSDFNPTFFLEPLSAIACGDGDPVTGGVEGLRSFYEKLREESFFGDGWMIHTSCAGWKVRTKAPFKGSFTQNTSHPILLIGNTADPVTPLWAAHKMSQGFNSSVVLTQDSPGHCSISATSLCTIKAIREYFLDGTLPAPGTVCNVEGSIFGGEGQFELYEATLSKEDKRLFKAARELHEKIGDRRTVL